MASEPDLLRVVLRPLHQSGVAYMVTGSVAAIAYGEPRMTNDVDVVVRLAADEGPRLLAEFPADAYYVPPLEVVEQERARPAHGHFNIIHRETALRADVYLAADDPLHAWAFDRRHATPIGGDAIWFAPIEYVIVRKLEYYRDGGSDRHLSDIRGIMRVSGDLVATGDLERLIADRGLGDAWRRANSN